MVLIVVFKVRPLVRVVFRDVVRVTVETLPV